MMRRRAIGRPILRTAVVGGAAYMAGSSMAKKSAAEQQAEEAQNAQIADLQQQAAMQASPQYQPQPTYAPPPATELAAAPAPSQDPIAMLKQLGDLKAAGVLTDEEFAAKKAELLKQI